MEARSMGRGSRITRTGFRLVDGQSECSSERRKTNVRFWEGQDVLARWTDGLLYLGSVKNVDKRKESCLVRFEDNSEFWVLWKDIYSQAAPGVEEICYLCREGTSVLGNKLIHCDKCRHAYHELCHLPPIKCTTDWPLSAWVCRHCIFAVATKRGGALKKGPYAQAMLAMKLILPYQLADLEWDCLHQANQQQCYCYCGGPGEWFLKMLQCCCCEQWFHESCTQCLSKPLLYGDRFYRFHCAVCNQGPETVERLHLQWVDVAHLILYHLSMCCKKKYFDFEREILAFLNENWDNLLLGPLSDTPKSERYDLLLDVLNRRVDRFVSGKEIKKKKCLFGLLDRAPAPLPPNSILRNHALQMLTSPRAGLSFSGEKRCIPVLNDSSQLRKLKKYKRRMSREIKEQRTKKTRTMLKRVIRQDAVQNPSSHNQRQRGYADSTSVYNFRKTDARCTESSPKKMFASFHPTASTAGHLKTASCHHPSLPQFSDTSADSNGSTTACEPFLDTLTTELSEHLPGAKDTGTSVLQVSTTSKKRSRQSIRGRISQRQARPSSSHYFGTLGCLAQGQPVRILARRITVEGTVQYLVEWEGSTIF
ncbi:PHD finger protein 1 [Protopterus annectens]|uniref:PHD finger protein 1 n=1 Tax=Protopterus annectens TaxID=7888 RepID=UPI001CF93D99|nr:PHD finger protein 1 [Protopterus annectens]